MRKKRISLGLLVFSSLNSPSVRGSTNINQLTIRIMSTKSYFCESLAAVERIIADKQEIYSHVEMMGWSGNRLTLAVMA